MDVVVLQVDEHCPVELIDGTVRRRRRWWTPAVHHLLAHLQDCGFAESPRVIGFDDRGREMLSFIEGDSGREAGSRVSSLDGLANFAALLRRFHDVIRDYEPPPDADWALPATTDAPATGVCHGDFAPWNMVWIGEEPIGIIDFDLAHPAPLRHDVAYALSYSVPFRDDATTRRMLSVDDVPDRRHRVEVFAEAYGVSDEGLVEQVVARQQKYAHDVEVLAQRGFVAQWTTRESIRRNHEIARWVADNQRLFRN
jgi:hypothetical protein